MEDDHIFLLILLLTCVNFAQIVCLARYRQIGCQATDKRPILIHYMHSNSTVGHGV